MNEKHFIALAIAASLGALAPASAAWAQEGGFDFEHEGGYVKPCSLDGVNPGYHPNIFGNAAIAREYGFVQSPDGAWHVSCGARAQALTGSGEGISRGAPHRNHRTASHGPSRKITKSE